MSRIARSETVTGAKLDQLRVMLFVAFFAGMTVGLLLAVGWDAAFAGNRPTTVETDITVKEIPAAPG
jgi:hypothetical protein